MGNKDRFSNLGAKLGQKLDDITDKVSQSGIKEEAKKLYNKASEAGSEVIKKVSEQIDDQPKEYKYCVCCGNLITSKRTRKLADGELCPSCSINYSEYIRSKNVRAANITFNELNEEAKKFSSKQKNMKTIKIVAFSILFVVAFYIAIKEEHKGKIQIPEISSVYYGNEVTKAENGLKEYGFTNIWIEELDDLNETQTDKENTVDHIAIEGSKKLSTEDWVEPTSKVTIYVHSIPEPEPEPEPIKESNTSSSDSSSNNNSSISSSKNEVTDEDVDAFVEIMNYALVSTAEEIEGFEIFCSRLGGVIYIDCVYDGAYDVSKYAKEISGEYHKAWNDMVDTMVSICNNVKDAARDTLGTSKYTTILRLHNDYNYDDILLEVKDGTVKEDVVNKPSLIDRILD